MYIKATELNFQMTIDAAFQRINNLDVREPLRKFAPQWATVVIDRSGSIIDVLPHKEAPSLRLNREHMDKYPSSIQFTSWQGQYPDLEAFASKIENHVKAARLAEQPENVGRKWIKG